MVLNVALKVHLRRYNLDVQVCRGARGTIYVFVQTDSSYRLGDTSKVNNMLR